MLGSSILSTLLALAAILLALSLFVQVFQEVYKYLTSSKARCYTSALTDFLGPWAAQMRRPGVLPDFQARGPFQFRRLRPRGILLPLERAELLEGMERTAPGWYRRALKQFRLEAELQGGQAQPPSAGWLAFSRELAATSQGAQGYWNARELMDFLGEWGHAIAAPPGPPPSPPAAALGALDAGALLLAFQERFLPHVSAAARHYPQLVRNFEYEYRRRNLRQTFMFGLLLALAANLPFDRLYRYASSLPADEAVAVAERTLSLYRAQTGDTRGPEARGPGQPAPEGVAGEAATPETPPRGAAAPGAPMSGTPPETAPPQAAVQGPPPAEVVSEEHVRAALDTWLAALGRAGAPIDYLMDRQFFFHLRQQGWWMVLRYVFGCMLTALLISFGAPFWNDLAGALFRIQGRLRGAGAPRREETG